MYARQYNNIVQNTSAWINLSLIASIVFLIVGGILIPDGAKKSRVVNANASSAEDEVSASLKKIKSLFDDGLISEAEYNEKKAQILERL